MDVDFYEDQGDKIPIYGMHENIRILLERMKKKDPEAVVFHGKRNKRNSRKNVEEKKAVSFFTCTRYLKASSNLPRLTIVFFLL